MRKQERREACEEGEFEDKRIHRKCGGDPCQLDQAGKSAEGAIVPRHAFWKSHLLFERDGRSEIRCTTTYMHNERSLCVPFVANFEFEGRTYEILILAAVLSRFGGLPRAVGGGGVDAGAAPSTPAASPGRPGVPAAD